MKTNKEYLDKPPEIEPEDSIFQASENSLTCLPLSYKSYSQNNISTINVNNNCTNENISRSNSYSENFPRRICQNQPQNTQEWVYTLEERNWLRWKVEMLTREQCVTLCVLGHMLLNENEITGRRDIIPTSEVARQSLLQLATGSHWDVYNLGFLIETSEKIPSLFTQNYAALISPSLEGPEAKKLFERTIKIISPQINYDIINEDLY